MGARSGHVWNKCRVRVGTRTGLVWGQERGTCGSKSEARRVGVRVGHWDKAGQGKPILLSPMKKNVLVVLHVSYDFLHLSFVLFFYIIEM